MNCVYTVGYEGMSPDVFIDLLQKEEISLVVDVRRNPISRKKGFSKTLLELKLGELNIKYSHYKSLGIESKKRKGLRDVNDYEALLEWYEEECIPQYDDVIDELIEKALVENVALLCVEADPTYCHRSIVARKMSERGVLRVSHLRIEGVT